MDEVFVSLLRQWGLEKLKARNILNQNGANLVFLHGQDMAKKLGLNPDDIMPYPGHAVVSIETPAPAPAPAPATPFWQKAAIGAGLTLPWLVAGALALQDKGPTLDPNVGFTIEAPNDPGSSPGSSE